MAQNILGATIREPRYYDVPAEPCPQHGLEMMDGDPVTHQWKCFAEHPTNHSLTLSHYLGCDETTCPDVVMSR